MRRSSFIRLLSVLMLVILLFAEAAPVLAVGQSSSLAKKGDRYVVAIDKLNCRLGPGMGYAVIAVFKKGTKLTYYGNTNGWWKVKASDGTAGYVDRQYLSTVSVEKTGNYYVTASELNIREQPKTSAHIRGTVKKGAIVTVTKQNGDWGYISAGAGVQGWAALKYLANYKKTTATDVKPAPTKKIYCEVTANLLNVRSGSSTRARKIDTIKCGEKCYILAVDGNWGRIVYKEKGKYLYGWVSLDYLRRK